MKFFRKCLIAIVVLLLMAGVLVWFLPASWVAPGLQSRLHGMRLQQVHGSIWNGDAGKVFTAEGQPLGVLHWRLSRRLLLGQVSLHMALHGPKLDFSGDAERQSDARVAWHNVHARVDLDYLSTTLAAAASRPGGELTLTVDHALLQGGWPLQLQATAQWRDAVVHADGKAIALGDLRGSAQAHEGVISADMQDTGTGPLQAQLQAALSPLGWRVQGMLRSRATDSALQPWLRQFGRPDASGTVHIQRSAGLAATLPAARPQGPIKHDP